MTFQQFTAMVIAAGFTPKGCSNTHWQILGGPRLINVWPMTKRGFVFQVDGMKAVVGGNLEAALDAADGVYKPGDPNGRPSEKFRRRTKRRLFAADPSCNYCKTPLKDMDAARLDHNIPLSKGGTSEASNLVLACVDCDTKKGNMMPDEFLVPDRSVSPVANSADETPQPEIPMLTQDQVDAVLGVFKAKITALQQEIADHEAAIEKARQSINSMIACGSVIRDAEVF